MNQCVRANTPAVDKYVVETQCGPGAPARRIWNKGQSQLIFCLSSQQSSDMTTRRINGAPVGLREANQNFSSLMQRVRNGEEVVLTERGKPFARIVPIRHGRQEDAIRRMVKEGLLGPAGKPGIMPDWKPRRLRGRVSTTEILREERDAH
jgi:prevent-host-death family protein